MIGDGNRLEEGKCIRCGDDLIDIANAQWNMCTGCIKLTTKDVKKMLKKKKEDLASPKKGKMWIPMLARPKA